MDSITKCVNGEMKPSDVPFFKRHQQEMKRYNHPPVNILITTLHPHA